MTGDSAAELLKACALAGIKLFAEGGKLKFRAPAGALTPELRSQLAEHKAELLALLQGEGTAEAVPVPEPAQPEPAAAEWNALTADIILAACRERLARALQPDGEANNPVRQSLIADYLAAVEAQYARQDPAFWEALDSVELLLTRWRRRDEEKAQSPPVPPAVVPVVSARARRKKGTDE